MFDVDKHLENRNSIEEKYNKFESINLDIKEPKELRIISVSIPLSTYKLLEKCYNKSAYINSLIIADKLKEEEKIREQRKIELELADSSKYYQVR